MGQKKTVSILTGSVAILIFAGLLMFRTLSSGSPGKIYGEDFEPGKNPAEVFGGNLLLGTENGWSGHLAEGKYILENGEDATAVRYFYINPEGMDIVEKGSRVVVEIGGNFPDGQIPSGAGLIFGLDARSGDYLAFVVMGQSSYGIFERNQDGLQMRMGGTHSAIRTDGINRLAIVSSGQSLQFTINGREIGSMGGDIVSGQGVGLLALGVGRFEFDDFQLEGGAKQASLATGSPAPQAMGRFLAAGAGLPALPKGFHRIKHDADSGELWIGGTMGGTSSRQVLLETLNHLEDAFQVRPTLHAVIGDAGDQETRALFGVRRGDLELRGLLVAARSDRGVTAACLFDAPNRLAESFQPMIQALAPHLPAMPTQIGPKPQPVSWQQVRLPDGSGSMMLPSGWQIVGASKGMVDAVGADGSQVSLGIHGPVLTPEMGAAYQQMPGATVRMPVAPYSDPVTALRTLFPQFGYQAPQRILRMIDTAPTAWPHGGQAVFVHFDWQQGEGNQTRENTSLALFGVMPGYGQWTFYLSVVSAPSQLFSQNLPMLMEIWKNWQVADHVHQERLESAASSMREIGTIIQQSHARRQQSQDRMAANWTEVFRDQTYLGDTRLGEHYSVPLTQVQDWTRELNRAAGYDRFRHIPLRDLQ